MPNVYQKMATVKQLLNKANLKKSGQNKFAGFEYYELKDFIPFLIDACANNGLLTRVSFSSELASLTVINIEAPEEIIEYTTPFIVPEVKGANACQNNGAAQTYCRRYLYLTAFDIVEGDAFDATIGAETDTRQRDTKARYNRVGSEPVVQHGGANREAYMCLSTSWEMTGKSVDKLDDWIKAEAVKQGVTKVDSAMLNSLNERIIAYMSKEA